MGPKDEVLLYVYRDHKERLATGTQDVHLDFHTALELCGTKTEAFSFLCDCMECVSICSSPHAWIGIGYQLINQFRTLNKSVYQARK